MDVEILSRIQFAFTIAFHYIYPPLSIGLGVVLVLMETAWLKTGQVRFHNMSRYWTRIFGLTFAIGVATGIVMEFEFGTNWATYSRFVGDVFGSPLAAEGIFAFFLESGFLAILLFGWDKVGPRLHYFATWMVCLGSHFSAIWIVVANSWMQTPAGYHFEHTLADGTKTYLPPGTVITPEQMQNTRAVIDDFWELLFNPSSVDRLIHVILGAWLAGAFLVISISAYYLLKGRHERFARTSLKFGLIFALVTSLLQLVSGDFTARGVAKNQPVKLAAIEGLFETQPRAPLGIVGFVEMEHDAEGNIVGGQTHDIGIPGMLSLLVHHDIDAPVAGLNDLPSEEFLRARHPELNDENLARIRAEYWPKVPYVFQFYHIMIALGMLMLVVAALGCFLWWRGKLFQRENRLVRAFLVLLVFSVLFPQIANQAGWFTAEMGRQPWVVYEVLKTSEAFSKAITANHVLASLIMFALIYALLFAVFVYVLHKKIQHGPREREDTDVLPEKWRPRAEKGCDHA